MQFGVLGISYKNASIEIRERFTLTTRKKTQLKDMLKEIRVSEYFFLLTCNRTEIYYVADDIQRISQHIKQACLTIFGEALDDYFYIKTKEQAINHIYNVACGFDSMVVGEDQILGQVKNALQFSMEEGTSQKIINKVVREAITFAKRVKTEYKISENPLTLSSIAVKYVDDKIDGYNGKNIMLIGTGEFGQLILKYVQLHENANIFVATRRHRKDEKIRTLMDEYENIKLIRFDERYQWVNKMDVVFTATASPHIILDAKKIDAQTRKTVLMDIAVPRDIDEKIKEIENMELYDIDDLKEVANDSLRYREKICKKVGKQIDNEVVKMMNWIESSRIDETISKLNKVGEDVFINTMAMIDQRLSLSDKDSENIKKIVRSCVKQMLKEPIKQMKAIEEPNEILQAKDMVEYLYRLNEG